MSTFDVDRAFPSFVNERRWCRNGQAPDGRFVKQAAEAINHNVAYRRKVLAYHYASWANLPAGIAGTNQTCHFGFHAGYGAEEVRAFLVLAKPDGGTDPYVTLSVKDGFSGGSTTTSTDEVHYGDIDAGASDVADEMYWGAHLKVAVSENTDYRCWLNRVDNARIASAAFVEWGTIPVDDSNGGTVDPQLGVDHPITDAETGALVQASSDLWRKNGAHIFNFIPEAPERAPSANAGGSYANLFDSTVTTVDANSPGHRIALQYHNSASATTVPVKMAVYARRTAGAGVTSFNKVRCTDGTNHIEITGINDTANTWYTATGTLPATDDLKVDIHAGNAITDTVKIYCVSLFELD
jgi:hypothetical protein